MRRAWLDVSSGERRGVVTLDGRPERLWIERDGDPAGLRLGARVAARVRRVEPALRLAFLDLGAEPPAAAALTPALTEGAAMEVEITAEPRRGKGPTVRLLGPVAGPAPRLLCAAPTLEARLHAAAPDRSPTLGEAAREAADVAVEAGLSIEHALPGGGSLAIERTRALTAVDVDLGGGARGDAARAARRINLLALAEAARLLRLKSLGGLIVIDLVGGAQASEPLLAAARAAFAADDPGVIFGPFNRFGLLQLVKPWRETPVEERLLDPDGRASLPALAADLVRALDRAGRLDPGGLYEAVCGPDLAAFAGPLVAALGPRFRVAADLGRGATSPDIRRR